MRCVAVVALMTILIAVPEVATATENSAAPRLIWTALDKAQDQACRDAFTALLGPGTHDRQRRILLRDGVIFVAYRALENGDQLFYYEHLRTHECRVYSAALHAITGGRGGTRIDREYTAEKIGEFLRILQLAATVRPTPSRAFKQLSLR